MSHIQDIRPSPIAGQWYPSDPKRLASQVDEFIRAARKPVLTGEVVGILAPHAGHRYSGGVAGHAFAALQDLKPDLVAVISPMHYPHQAALLTTAHQAYATPLGDIPVDHDSLIELDAEIQDRLGFGLTRIIRDPEHSLEIELPFLQRVFTHPFKLLPVMVRDQSEQVAEALGHALGVVLSKRKAILLASSDLSHFYPQYLAEKLDSEMLHQVGLLDPHGVYKTEEEGKGFACGRVALCAVLWAAKDLGANQAEVINYATSGDITGDYSQVVGYGAAVFIRQVGEKLV